MKEIKAYVRAAKRDAVIDALEELGTVPGFAIVPVMEFGHAVTSAELERVDLLKLEIDVPDHMVAPIVDAISASARTGDGHMGDGRIVVLDITAARRIADGSEDEAALL